MLNRETLLAEADARFGEDRQPQKHALAKRYTNELFDALSALAALGMVLDAGWSEAVVAGHPAYQEFPMWVSKGDEGRVVDSSEELAAAVEDGWVAPAHYTPPPAAPPAEASPIEA